MCGSPNTSPTGRLARSCWPRQMPTAKPVTRTKSQSVSSAIPRSDDSCSSVSRRCRLDPTLRGWPWWDQLAAPKFATNYCANRQAHHSSARLLASSRGVSHHCSDLFKQIQSSPVEITGCPNRWVSNVIVVGERYTHQRRCNDLQPVE